MVSLLNMTIGLSEEQIAVGLSKDLPATVHAWAEVTVRDSLD